MSDGITVREYPLAGPYSFEGFTSPEETLAEISFSIELEGILDTNAVAVIRAGRITMVPGAISLLGMDLSLFIKGIHWKDAVALAKGRSLLGILHSTDGFPQGLERTLGFTMF